MRGITVLFATCNGARTLPRMLAALERLAPPARPWRIVAVENGSSDASAEILTAAAERLPMTVLRSPAPGKVAALKLGAREASGDLVVFTDDDVEPVPQWLAAYEAAAEAHPEADAFAGPVEPTPLEPLSGWYEASCAHHGALFARLPLADGPISWHELFGPNFMLRREHLSVLDEIPDWFGPTAAKGRAQTFPLADDGAIMTIAAGRGLVPWGVAAARVGHLVRGFQTELPHMLGRARRHGRGWAMLYLSELGPTPKRRLSVIRSSAARALGPARAEGATPDAALFDRLWRVNWARGAMLGAAFGPFVPMRRVDQFSSVFAGGLGGSGATGTPSSTSSRTSLAEAWP